MVTPEQFITKWKAAELKERSAAQSHFIDLCRMLDEPGPTDADPKGEWYAFERGATKTTGGDGWADVWKRGHFGWEYKGKRKDLDAAFAQLQQYALALENPPLLVVCDLNRFRIRTNWTNSVSEVHEFALEELYEPSVRQKLKWVLSDPDRLRPGKTRQGLTEQAAGEFADLAQRLRTRGHRPETVAHFINRLVFCMFAEDVDLLPNKMFKRMLEHAQAQPQDFEGMARDLFGAMRAGGKIGFERVAWFNGGLFNDDMALPLEKDDITLALRAADLDWEEIDPSILGTLFERGLDPDKRSQLGAHYTDREKIMLIVEPVITQPWLIKWADTKTDILNALEKAKNAKSPGSKTKSKEQAIAKYRAFLDELRAFRVLDPACGSGNFLYLALLALKDLEHRVSIEAEAMGLQREFPQVSPVSVKGIEINPYAAELARVSVWIGEIQWMRRNGFGVSRDPILKPLDNIECRDAILNRDGTKPTWPAADVIIGNPPFLGDKKMLEGLGGAYVDALRSAYVGEVAGGADLVTYWFERAGELVASGTLQGFGFVSTNGIRFGKNRAVVDQQLGRGLRIFNAVSDSEWSVDGADVRVSIVCMDTGGLGSRPLLDGRPVQSIFADLTGGSSAVDLTTAAALVENSNVSFFGVCLAGPFGVTGEEARALLSLPSNPNGALNTDVVKPLWNGIDVLRRHQDRWVIDFGPNMTEAEAALYESPFKMVMERVRPVRLVNRDQNRRTYWWRHGRPRPGLRTAGKSLTRWLITPETSKHRVFRWLPKEVDPEHSLIVIARDDDTTFGILQSRFHLAWVERLGNRLGVGNDLRYNSTRTFETFPFPHGLTPNLPAATYAKDPRAQKIAAAAKRLHELRELWLNPPELVDRTSEIAPNLPDRLLPINEKAAAILKKRTLTNLYNERPAWLANAHKDLDDAVAEAYGWPQDISEDEALARLLALNRERSSKSTLPTTSDE